MRIGKNKVRGVLVLWDIDHTLLETRGVGRDAFGDAFERVTGHALMEMPHITGRTEPDIYAATTRLHRIDNPPPFTEFADALAVAYQDRRTELAARGRALPGAVEALATIAQMSDVHQSVLSGNTRAVARIKLEAFDLAAPLDLDIGAYGDDDGHRPALVSIAQARAATHHGAEFGRTNTVLIGDSPGDIETAVRGGARVIAVAAGGTTAAELSAADMVLDELTDVDGISGVLRACLHGVEL